MTARLYVVETGAGTQKTRVVVELTDMEALAVQRIAAALNAAAATGPSLLTVRPATSWEA